MLHQLNLLFETPSQRRVDPKRIGRENLLKPKKTKNYEIGAHQVRVGEGLRLVEPAIAGLGVGRVAQVVEAAVVVAGADSSLVLHHRRRI